MSEKRKREEREEEFETLIDLDAGWVGAIATAGSTKELANLKDHHVWEEVLVAAESKVELGGTFSEQKRVLSINRKYGCKEGRPRWKKILEVRRSKACPGREGLFAATRFERGEIITVIPGVEGGHCGSCVGGRIAVDASTTKERRNNAAVTQHGIIRARQRINAGAEILVKYDDRGAEALKFMDCAVIERATGVMGSGARNSIGKVIGYTRKEGGTVEYEVQYGRRRDTLSEDGLKRRLVTVLKGKR